MKLNASDRDVILKQAARGMSQKDIAKAFRVTVRTIATVISHSTRHNVRRHRTVQEK